MLDRIGIDIIKVKAHCRNRSDQDPYLTFGNSMVDEAARALAKQAIHGKNQSVRERIQGAVSWQCHIIIATLSQPFANRWMCPDVLEADPAGRDCQQRRLFASAPADLLNMAA